MSGELRVIYSIAEVLANKTDSKDIIETVLRILSEEAGMKRGMITLLMRDFQEVHLDVAPGMDDLNIQKIKYGVGEGITGRVISKGRPMAIPKLDEAPFFLDRTGARKKIDRSKLAFICVPITYCGEVVGALSVDTVARVGGDLANEVKFLSAVADMIAYFAAARRTIGEERDRLERERINFKQEVGKIPHPSRIIGKSRLMQMIYSMIHQVAESDTTVLLTGETGTGKELVAKAIHESSPRASNPIVYLNCAALPDNLIESELFGHERGAFTGALEKRIGKFEAATGGTLFLDEIGELSASAQAKVLRVLQDRVIERIGGNKSVRVNVRMIAATNRNLELEVERGTFRSDLFYRLNVFPIHMPPLRERGADILLLADFFVKKYSEELKKNVTRISSPAISALMAYYWPGNVRELENCIERAVLVSTDETIHTYNLPPTLQVRDQQQGEPGRGSLEQRVSAYEREIIEEALKYSRGNQSLAAGELCTTRRIIQYKIDKYGIDFQKYR
jgi:Nif-specific regulatory protein